MQKKTGMKKYFSLISLVLALGLVSCEKELLPSEEYPFKEPQFDSITGLSMWGKFLVVDGVMYVDNNETGERKVYRHFGVGKDTSSLRWGGHMFDIEVIIRNRTTYSFYKPINFPGYGDFILNGDSSKQYAVYHVGYNHTIVEDPVYGQSLMGGSARPFSGQTISEKDSLVALQIQEMEGSIDGYNCHYWTQLTLKKIESW